MRHTQDLKNFIQKWKECAIPNAQVLWDYRPMCKELLLHDEELVRETTSILRRNIEGWARSFSPVYKKAIGIISKDDLWDSSIWHVATAVPESQPMSTSGSTNGRPFPYLRWEPFLYFIEADNHYDLIMDEFEVKDNPEVMYFFNTTRYQDDIAITVKSDSDNFMEHHGLKRKANVHYVNFRMFKDDKSRFFEGFFDHISRNSLDVIFAPGPCINSICHEIKSSGSSHKLCRLLSNSNEKIMAEDASFLMGGIVDHICDHMRCWDGGATFFTCKHMNYHIMDNLSWCEEVDGKMVSTDYFSLPSPFVRYWNGDFCRIADTYQRCECGRLYREFDFMENRPFALKGRSILEIKETLDSLRIMDIKQVRCSPDSIEIVSRSPIQETHRQVLRRKHRFNFRFTVENEIRPT